MEKKDNNSYLAFSIDGEIFAIDVHSVIEVKDAEKLTKLPIKVNMVRGLLQYADEYLPVIDSRAKFDFAPKPESSREVFVVAEIEKPSSETLKFAFTADKVLGVVQIDENKISDMPQMGVNKVEYITGIAKSNGNSIILLDVSKVFSVDEIMLIERAKLEIV